jgi:hypothetical protein
MEGVGDGIGVDGMGNVQGGAVGDGARERCFWVLTPFSTGSGEYKTDKSFGIVDRSLC